MRWTLLIAFICLGSALAAQPVQYDTSVVHERTITRDAIKRYKQQEEFQYIQQQEPPQSIWDKFWNWFWWKINQILRTKSGRITFWTVLSLIAAVIVGYFALKVAGMQKGGLFSRKSAGLNYTVGEENIHEIAFDEAIQDAIRNGNFRQAVRLLYLQCLKQLSDKGYIEWQINKTNNDYSREVDQQSWHSLFRSLTWKFEYTCYGEMKVGRDDFEKMQLQFQQLNREL